MRHLDFWLKSKNLIFGSFWARFAQILKIFFRKSDFISFLDLSSPNFMQKIRKKQWANSEILASWTDGHTDGHTHARLIIEGISPAISLAGKREGIMVYLVSEYGSCHILLEWRQKIVRIEEIILRKDDVRKLSEGKGYIRWSKSSHKGS